MYSRVCFSSVREKRSRYRQCVSGKGWCAHAACVWLAWGYTTQFCKLNKRQFNLSPITLWRAKEWMIPTQVLKRYPYPAGGRWSQPYRILLHGQRKTRQFFRGIGAWQCIFFMFFSDLRVGTKTPRRISATGVRCCYCLVSVSPAHRTTYPPAEQFFDVWIFVFQKASCLWK